jgi:hypothetical protein
MNCVQATKNPTTMTATDPEGIAPRSGMRTAAGTATPIITNPRHKNRPMCGVSPEIGSRSRWESVMRTQSIKVDHFRLNSA